MMRPKGAKLEIMYLLNCDAMKKYIPLIKELSLFITGFALAFSVLFGMWAVCVMFLLFVTNLFIIDL